MLDASLLLLPFITVWLGLKGIEGWPQNDDPFYAKSIAALVDQDSLIVYRQQGQLSASALAHMACGGFVCKVLGYSYHNLYLTCIVQQWLGAMLVYWAIRVFDGRRIFALLFSFCFALTPIYFGHAFTFMTDGPATAWAAIAMAGFVLGFSRQSLRWLLVGSFAIAWGFWIRQTNLLLLVAPLSVLLYEIRCDRSARRHCQKLLIITALPALAVLLMETGLLGHSSSERLHTIAPDPWSLATLKQTVISVYGLGLLIGLLALPLLPLLIRELRQALHSASLKEKRIVFVASVSPILVWLLPFCATQGRASLTNSTGCFLQNGHWGPIFLSDMDEPERWGDLGGVQWPMLVWQVASMICIIALGALVGWAAWSMLKTCQAERNPGIRRYQLRLATSILLTIALAVMLMLLFVNPLLDRYWLYLFPPLLLWLALLASDHQWNFNRLSQSWAAISLLLLFATSLVFTHDNLTWNNLRWEFVQNLLADGLQPEAIDAGRDVNAWLRMDEDPDTYPREGDTSSWWSGRAVLALAVGPRPGWDEIDRLDWFAWATGKHHAILVLRKRNASDGSPLQSKQLLAGQE